MVKRVDLAVYEAARDLRLGRFAAGNLSWGLREQGVTLAPVRVDFPGKDEAMARIAQLEQQIGQGSLKVPSRREELGSPGQP
jgi:basic membrane protein A